MGRRRKAALTGATIAAPQVQSTHPARRFPRVSLLTRRPASAAHSGSPRRPRPPTPRERPTQDRVRRRSPTGPRSSRTDPEDVPGGRYGARAWWTKSREMSGGSPTLPSTRVACLSHRKAKTWEFVHPLLQARFGLSPGVGGWTREGRLQPRLTLSESGSRATQPGARGPKCPSSKSENLCGLERLSTG